MSSSRPVLKRPAANTPKPQFVTAPTKPAISFEEWEAKAPLQEKQLKSVGIIHKACDEKILPPKFNASNDRGSRSPTSSPDESSSSGSSSRPTTPPPDTSQISSVDEFNASNGALSRSSTPLRGRPDFAASPVGRTRTPSPSTILREAAKHSLYPREPIQANQQLYEWFAQVEASVVHSQESKFRDHLARISGHIETCDGLIATIDDMEEDVDNMYTWWRQVEDGGKSMQDACEQLLAERDKLLKTTDAIGARLQYFLELERAVRMLNQSGENLVLQTDFLDMVERVDICIEFMREHHHYKEADIYLLRYQQCLTRAMTLIRMFFIGALKTLTADISKRLLNKEMSSTTQTHLLYTRFQSLASQVGPLLGELERRTKGHPEELSALLYECHTAYFNSRKSLLVGRLSEEIRGLDPVKTELVELTRAGCSYLKQLCIDEFSLFRKFFNSGGEQLYQYLESLCDYLYDDLRPRILHEPRLTILCEVCTVLQALMVLDVPVISTDPTSSDDEDQIATPLSATVVKPKAKKGMGVGRLHIGQLLQTVLQDAQTRLFFKAQAMIQSDVQYYVPKPEDLDYPSKLTSARKITNGFTPKEKEAFNPVFQLPSLEKRETWYPTLAKTIWILSQLHDFVQPAIFEDIAQEAIAYCRASLVSASELIASKNSGASAKLDGQLFLIRHLLILKEMTGHLNLSHHDVYGTLDFKQVTDALKDMLRTTSFAPYTFGLTLGGTRGVVNAADPKQSIDQDLKRTCEDVIASTTLAITQQIRTFQITSATKAARSSDVLQKEATEADKDFRLTMQKELPAAAFRMRLYLEDNETASALLLHVQGNIVDEYTVFRNIVLSSDVANGVDLFSVDELRTVVKSFCEDVMA